MNYLQSRLFGGLCFVFVGLPVVVVGDAPRSCGHDCIRVVLGAYGNGEVLRVAEMPNQSSKQVMSITTMVALLTESGVGATAVHGDEEDLLRQRYPVILHWHPADNAGAVGHFVVLFPGAGPLRQVFDPVRGEVLLSPGRLARRMSGFAVLTSPDEGRHGVKCRLSECLLVIGLVLLSSIPLMKALAGRVRYKFHSN